MHRHRIKHKYRHDIAKLEDFSSQEKEAPITMEFKDGDDLTNRKSGDWYVVNPDPQKSAYEIMMEESENHMAKLREAIARGVNEDGNVILNGKKLAYYGPAYERDEEIERKDVEQCQSIIKDNMPKKPQLEIQLRIKDKVNQDNLLDGLWDIPEKHEAKTYFDNIHLSNFFDV